MNINDLKGNYTVIGNIQSRRKPEDEQPDNRSGLQKAGDIVVKVFPGQKVGESIGTLAGLGIEKVRGLVGKQDNSAFYDTSAPSVLQTVGDVAAGAATVAGLKAPVPKGTLAKAGQMAGYSAAVGAGGSAAEGRDYGDIFKSAILSGTIGAGFSLGTSAVGKAANALTKKAPGAIYNTAIKTDLTDTKKAIKFGGKTLGEELVEKGVSGSEKGLLDRAIKEIGQNEDKLQKILKSSKQTIARDELSGFLDDLIQTKSSTPGLMAEVDGIRNVLKEFPEQVTLAEANVIKRNLYNALSDTAFRIDPNLSTKRDAMKSLAKGIKTLIEDKTASEAGEGAVKAINQELSVFGKLQDRALDKIARANKNNLLGLGDIGNAILGSVAGGLTTGDVSGVAGGAALGLSGKAIGSTLVKTKGSVALSKIGKQLDKLADPAGRISKAAVMQLLRNMASSNGSEDQKKK